MPAVVLPAIRAERLLVALLPGPSAGTSPELVTVEHGPVVQVAILSPELSPAAALLAAALFAVIQVVSVHALESEPLSWLAAAVLAGSLSIVSLRSALLAVAFGIATRLPPA